MNAQKFSMIIGLVIIFGHILLVFWLLFYFNLPEESKIVQISLPITTAYISGIILWFFDHRGEITSEAIVNKYFMAAILLIIISLFLSLFYVPFHILNDPNGSIDTLNDFYLYIEMAFGGAFGLIMSKLFEVDQKAS